jgi:hypothetical protein
VFPIFATIKSPGLTVNVAVKQTLLTLTKHFLPPTSTTELSNCKYFMRSSVCYLHHWRGSVGTYGLYFHISIIQNFHGPNANLKTLLCCNPQNTGIMFQNKS